MSKTVAERQRDCRQRKRDIPENVTCHDKSGPQDAPQSTNGGQVVSEHPQIAAVLGVAGLPVGLEGTMSDAELIRRLHYITDWKQSDEYKEVLSRRVA